MPWQGIWFDPEATEGKSRSPEWFQGFVPPMVYPYPHGFIAAEEARLRASPEPDRIRRDGEVFNVFYALSHDGCETGLNQQGCNILRWLFHHFGKGPEAVVSRRFCEVPVVIHEPHPAKAAALANAIVLLRFLDADPDQAIARILLQPWTPMQGGPRVTAQEFEKRTLEFLHGELYYPEGVTLFDVLERRDLRNHRALGPCCETQMGFIRSILEWVDECWPQTSKEGRKLSEKLRRSLLDEAKLWQ